MTETTTSTPEVTATATLLPDTATPTLPPATATETPLPATVTPTDTVVPATPTATSTSEIIIEPTNTVTPEPE
jgi:chitinase